MFLSMLTADAASKHGHEFSEPQQPNRWNLAPRRSPLQVLPYARRPRVPARSRSVRGTMGELKEEPEDVEMIVQTPYHDCSVEDLSIPGAFPKYSPPTSLPSDLTAEALDLSTSSIVDRVSRLNAQTITADDGYIFNTTTERRSRRSKTQYSLAQPPPSTLPLRKQGLIRPRVLFQLQAQNNSKFHKPVFEVSPLSRYDSSKKVTQRLRRLCKGKHHVSCEDLAVLRIADPPVVEASSSTQDPSDSRDVLGIITPLVSTPGKLPGQVQIILEDVVWQGTPSGDGKYDLKCLDNDTISARWYLPRARRKLPDGTILQSSQQKYYFAIMQSHTRKHPTLASLNKFSLDMYDYYTPAQAHYTPDSLASPSESLDVEEDACLDEVSQTPDIFRSSDNSLPLDEAQRQLIIISAFWVMLCENWSPYYNFSSIVIPQSSTPAPPIARSMSLPVSHEASTASTHLKPSITPRDSPSPAPEQQTTSCRSSLRSVSIDATAANSRRISLSTFPFRRSSTIESVMKFEDIRAAHSLTSSKAPSIDIPLATATAVEISTDKTQREHQPSADESKKPDLTAQFRHLLTLEKPSLSMPSKPILSRFDSIRRRNTIVISSADQRRRSWNWNLSLPSRSKSRNGHAGPRSPSVGMTHNNHPIGNDHVFADDHSVISITPSAEIGAASATISEDTTVVDDSVIEPGMELKSSVQTVLPDEQQDEASTTAVEVQPTVTEISITTVSSTTPVTVDLAMSSSEEEHSRRSSTDSSEGESLHFGAPYWKDFDRLHTDSFMRRRQPVAQPTQVNLASLASISLVTDVDVDISLVHDDTAEKSAEVQSPRKGWFSSLNPMGRLN